MNTTVIGNVSIKIMFRSLQMDPQTDTTGSADASSYCLNVYTVELFGIMD